MLTYLDVDPGEREECPALPEDADVLRDEGVDALGQLGHARHDGRHRAQLEAVVLEGVSFVQVWWI